MSELGSVLRGFTFNDKHNYKDMKVVMHNKTIQSPSKKKIKESVPFMNGSYDFSTIGSNGEITYDERQIKITLGLNAHNKEGLQVIYSKVINWLVNTGRSRLIFDEIIDYYYIAEVESVTTLDELISFGKVEVTFIAQPFKTCIHEEGGADWAWDTFNFEEDLIQQVQYDVNLAEEFTVVNVGIPVCPTIISTAPLQLTLNDKNYKIVVGNNKFYDLKLATGENNFIVAGGFGTVKVIWRKVAI